MDSTAAGQFDAYDQDFQHLIDGIRTKLDEDARSQQGEQRKTTLRKVEMELDDADDIISQLEIEIQGIPISVRSPYNTRLKKAKSDLTRYKKVAKDMHAQAARSELVGPARFAASSDDPYTERDERSRLLAGTEILSDGTRRLNGATNLALETEDVGADILQTLRQQREQIENSRNTLQSADMSIDRASGTIKKMIRQMYKQRFVIGAIGIVLVVVIVLILYFKLRR